MSKFKILIMLLCILLGCQLVSEAQEATTRSISGIVKDVDGLPIPGATVYAPLSSAGTATSLEGTFSLRVRTTEEHLLVSYIGMKKAEITLKSDKEYYEITLREETKALDEVVVTGYQTISKERTTGSFYIAGKEELDKKINPSVLGRLEGAVAGMRGRSEEDLSIRGVATLLGNSKPLIVVDGMPIEGSLSNINPATIENITVLKDAAAASIYGARAANGVIVISTLKGDNTQGFRAMYDGSVLFTRRPSFDYLHMMSSEQLVDLSMDIIDQNFSTVPWSALETSRTSYPYTLELYSKHTEGLISDEEYEAEVQRMRATDNRDAIRDELLRTGILDTHNLTLIQDGKKSNFVATINYRGDRPTNVGTKSDDIGYSLRNVVHFSDQFLADLTVSGNYGSSFSQDGSPDALGMIYQLPSYIPLTDKEGNYLDLPTTRSNYSKHQLLEWGLEDESYNPLRDRAKEWSNSKSNYTRVNASLSYKILPELSMSGSFQIESAAQHIKRMMEADSYTVRQMRNDATIQEDGKYISLIPEGGQLSEYRSSTSDYTARLQLNYDKVFASDHRLTALAGAEIRRLYGTGTSSYLMGYDDVSLGSVPYDALRLSQLNGTMSLSGSFSFNNSQHNYVRESDDRFVSFYTNFAYDYLTKYNLTGSIRIDQSNLFGVDPKVQYRPLWSLGGSWSIHKEDFMKSQDVINRLVLRTTYGIGGNIPKVGGPYMIVKTGGFNTKAQTPSSEIASPPNRSLTWERTATFNVGVDFALFQNRLSGSIEVYNRHTTNLLGTRLTDPTIGWSNVLMNYGSMSNKGLELTLNSTNVATRDFRWSTDFVFSFNKNKILDIDEEFKNVEYYITNGIQTSGKPANSLYSLSWAGLYATDDDGNRTELGIPHIYTTDDNGTRVVTTGTTNVDDLIHEGTMTPVWNGGLTNTLEYQRLSLSFSLVYYGGHKLRDVMAPYVSNFQFLTSGVNVDESIMNAWKKEGDELLPETTPMLPNNDPSSESRNAWYGANIHVISGDYIRLRDIVLSYSLSEKLLDTLRLSSCTVRLQANNLCYWAKNDRGIDPEAYSFGFGRPPRRLPASPATYSLGISLSF